MTFAHTHRSLKALSAVTLVCFIANISSWGASIAWASNLIPGADQTNQPQGTAKNPDALLANSNQWDTITVNNNTTEAEQDENTYFGNGLIKSTKNKKTGATTEYTYDSSNRIKSVTNYEWIGGKLLIKSRTEHAEQGSNGHVKKISTDTRIDYTYEMIDGSAYMKTESIRTTNDYKGDNWTNVNGSISLKTTDIFTQFRYASNGAGGAVVAVLRISEQKIDYKNYGIPASWIPFIQGSSFANYQTTVLSVTATGSTGMIRATKTIRASDGITTVIDPNGFDTAFKQHQSIYADQWASLEGGLAVIRQDRNEYDAVTGRLTRTVYGNGDIKSYDANGLVTEFWDSSKGITTTYHPGTDKIKTVSSAGGSVKSFDLAGRVIRQDEINGNYVLYSDSGAKTFFFNASAGDKTSFDPATGLIQKIIFGDGRVDWYDASGKPYRQESTDGSYRLLDPTGKTMFVYDAKTGSKTEHDPASFLVKTVTLNDGTVQRYTQGVLSKVEYVDGSWKEVDAAGNTLKSHINDDSQVTREFKPGDPYPFKESYPDGSYRLLGPTNNIIKAHYTSTNVTLEYDSIDVQDRMGRLIKSTRENEGLIETYTYNGDTRVVASKEVRNMSGLLLSKSENGNEYAFWPDGSTVRTLRRTVGSYEEYSPTGKLTGERFAVPDSSGALGYEYDDRIQASTGKGRKTKTTFQDGSYIITTYKNDAELLQEPLNTESFFDKDSKNLRTLVYNSKGTQVRWMTTEDARTLDCFFDACWKEDMGFDTSWSAAVTGAKVAVIEAGSVDSAHAMAVAGILKRVTGQNSDIAVVTAADHLKVIEAMKQAARDGFNVINLSLEFLRSGVITWGSALGYDPERAVAEFKTLLQAGVNEARAIARDLGSDLTIVASAGNQGQDFSVIGDLEGVISVGSTDYLGRRVETSGFGQGLDFMASGYKVWSDSTSAAGALWTGTSFAAPMISGMIAGLSVVKNALGLFTQEQILGTMKSSAKDLGASGWDKYFGWGKANAGRAMRGLASGIYQLIMN